MLRVEFDLEKLSLEELDEAKQTLHHDLEEVAAHDPRHVHPELMHLFEALELAVRERAAARHALEEQHEIALALGIDEDSGEWLAGA